MITETDQKRDGSGIGGGSLFRSIDGSIDGSVGGSGNIIGSGAS